MVTMANNHNSNNENKNNNSTQSITAKGRKANATMHAISQFRSHPAQLWRGYGALVARNLPFTAMHFPLFEHMREIITVRWGKRQGNSGMGSIFERAVITAVSAGVSGGIAATVTTPIDVVKTRIMLAAGKDNNLLKTASGKSPSSLAVGRQIYHKDGLKGLFKGGVLRGGWTALGIGLYLSAYESGRMYLEKRREHNIEDIS
jgi:hypothetical protein